MSASASAIWENNGKAGKMVLPQFDMSYSLHLETAEMLLFYVMWALRQRSVDFSDAQDAF